ncbi:MAG: SOS response-associated peptidase [Acetobacterium sp.]
MCGRYTLFANNENTEIIKMVAEVNRRYQVQIKTNDIFPSNLAPIIRGNAMERELDVMQWGYHNPFKKGLIINARSETVMEKKMFKDDFKNRRCLIPATGFYEWDKQKKQYLFSSDHILYLGGIYKPFEGKNKYVILTKAPNLAVSEVHDRMPVIISAGMVDHWLHDYSNALSLLNEDCVSLIKQQIETIEHSK